MFNLHEVYVKEQLQELGTRPLAVCAVLVGVEQPGGEFCHVAEDRQEERLLPPVGDDSLPDGGQVGGEPVLGGGGGQAGLGGGGRELAEGGGQTIPYLGREEGEEGGMRRAWIYGRGRTDERMDLWERED